MNIGYLHKDTWPPIRGDTIYSWEIIKRLQKRHSIFTDRDSPLPGVKKTYRSIIDASAFIRPLDVLLINVEGYFNWHTEKFTLFRLLKPTLPVVWITQAPLEESLLFGEPPHMLFIKNSMRKFFARFVSANVCVSDVMKHYAETVFRIPYVVSVPNGADPTIFTPRTKPYPFLADTQRFYKIFWVGSGEFPWQGIDVMTKVAKRMWKLDPTVLFVFINSSLSLPLLQLPNILWLQPVPNETLPTLLAAADACLTIYHTRLPNIGFYGSSSKLYNYMAMAKPVIVSSVGQMNAVIEHGVNGLLTNNDPSDIVKKIVYLKHHPKDARQMGKRARLSVLDYYNWDRVSEDIEAVLQKAIGAT